MDRVTMYLHSFMIWSGKDQQTMACVAKCGLMPVFVWSVG